MLLLLLLCLLLLPCCSVVTATAVITAAQTAAVPLGSSDLPLDGPGPSGDGVVYALHPICRRKRSLLFRGRRTALETLD